MSFKPIKRRKMVKLSVSRKDFVFGFEIQHSWQQRNFSWSRMGIAFYVKNRLLLPAQFSTEAIDELTKNKYRGNSVLF